MPIPSSFDDLSETPSSNSPPGSEAVGTQANEYFQTAFAFIRQLYDGVSKPIAALNFNGQKITNIAAGSTTSTSTDVLTGSQVRALAYKVGEVRIWHGLQANIASVWGPGWQVADGTNGTQDLRDRVVISAGGTYPVGTLGGIASTTLSIANMPQHNHGVNDPTHTHAVNDPPHVHGVNDPGHIHQMPFINNGAGNAGSGIPTVSSPNITTSSSATNISIQGSSTGVSLQASGTGVTTQNAGSGTAFTNLPPYAALWHIEYTGIGA